jgi:ribosomal protein S18 acetylase RimI-like enzyme
MNKRISIVQVDFTEPTFIEKSGSDMLLLLNAYACDPMGGGQPLSEYTQKNLLPCLIKRTDFFTVIAYVDNKPAGLINAIEGFSSFNARPLLNIHDVTVSPEYRGLGLSKLMFNTVDEIAKQRDCCKVTLEVLEGNALAKNLYTQLGYVAYELDPQMGKALFLEKKLS